MTNYDLSCLVNATSLTSNVSCINNSVEGWLFGALMMVFFIITLFTFYGWVGIGSLLTANGFILSIVGLLLVNAALLPEFVIAITFTLLVIGLLILFMGDG